MKFGNNVIASHRRYYDAIRTSYACWGDSSSTWKKKSVNNRNVIMTVILFDLCLTLLHSEKRKLYTILAFLNAIGLTGNLLELTYQKCFVREAKLNFGLVLQNNSD